MKSRTILRWEEIILPTADIGPENPLPMFREASVDHPIEPDPSVSVEDRRYLGWGCGWRILPHRMQDGYTRQKRLRSHRVLVLENSMLRAVVLPGWGGRVVSLECRPSGRELLARNPVLQPANLALRNAWVSGGIEWNAGQPGHHALTCAPVFAARLRDRSGDPILRLYEWDRVKRFFWQVDLSLPSDSPLLFARTRITNPHGIELPAYWWTNMAAPERSDTRVVVPAESALCNPYSRPLSTVELPIVDGVDVTYSTRVDHAFDFFSRIPDSARRWIAALDGEGKGLFETSTERLRGRKLFCWGMSRGGRWWQEFLAAEGHAYLEIQAGLARTQMECVPMPPKTEWSWTEAFGFLEADPARIHSEDWPDARAAVGEAIESVLPEREMTRRDAELAETADRPPEEVLSKGSGWGALERRRLLRDGSPDRLQLQPALPMDDAVGPEQEPWIELLETGRLPESDPDVPPASLMVQPEWRERLERSVGTPDGGHWLAWWHLGNAYLEDGDPDAARKAWRESLRMTQTGWALRNIAVAAERGGDAAGACEWMLRAWDTGPAVPSLAVETAERLVRAGRFREAREFIRSAPPRAFHERLLLLSAKAALETGELDGIEAIFETDFATIREGEVTLTDLWFAWHERRLAREEGAFIDEQLRERVRRDYPPPRRLDFRMHAGPKS